MAKLLVTTLTKNADPTEFDTVANMDEDGGAITWANNMDHEVKLTGDELIVVTKGTGMATATFETRAGFEAHGIPLDPRTYTISANDQEFIPPFDPAPHIDSDGYANLQFTNVTGLQVAVFRFA